MIVKFDLIQLVNPLHCFRVANIEFSYIKISQVVASYNHLKIAIRHKPVKVAFNSMLSYLHNEVFFFLKKTFNSFCIKIIIGE